ncbi:Wzz/FepE/Etk N-terminal domain-containing protein [Rhizobacter sp. J219]|nr:Wzz/FepE/Etk N-terminal domain-containing protein [Rhizobacter sp. J219]MCR5883534.1 Wzz/FepE/Etk N-terminal domain-containing protein [Rhizobacter sp. J219]
MNGLNLRQILLILRLRWPLVLALFVLVMAVAFVVSLRMPKKFTAETSLLLDVRADPLVATLMPSIASREFLGTQVEIIQSERLAGRVAKMLGMTEGPAAVEQWRQATQGRVPIESYYGSMLRNGLSVVPARNTNLIDIGFTGGDPRFVAAAANAFAKAYIEFSVELRIEPSRQYGTFFDERLKILRTQLEEAQRKLSTFQRERGIIATERVDLESSRLATTMAQLAAAQAELADTNSRQRNTGTETSPDVQSSAVVQGLKSEARPRRNEAPGNQLHRRLQPPAARAARSADRQHQAADHVRDAPRVGRDRHGEPRHGTKDRRTRRGGRSAEAHRAGSARTARRDGAAATRRRNRPTCPRRRGQSPQPSVARKPSRPGQRPCADACRRAARAVEPEDRQEHGGRRSAGPGARHRRRAWVGDARPARAQRS